MSSQIIWNGIDLTWAYADLFSSIRRRTHCNHNALDILHDALIRFAIHDNQNKQAKPHAYLNRIVDHLLIDNARHQANQFKYITNHARPLFGTDYTPSAEHVADVRQRLELLSTIISNLPPKCRQVFWMYRVEGLSQQAIADALGISLNMVEKHMIRALLDLKSAKDLLN